MAHDLVTNLWAESDNRNETHGALVRCEEDGEKVSIWTYAWTANAGHLYFGYMNGPNIGVTRSLVLAGGLVFPRAEQAKARGLRRGTIGNVTIKQNLVGADTHTSALVGSTDGWLYSVDACRRKLDWAYDFKFPVGQPILADTSGDGKDEILVTVADGYLYNLSQQLIARPAFVFDVDPLSANPRKDVDTIYACSGLNAHWGEVAGADGYEVALVTAGGTFVTQPSWNNVGNRTDIQLGGLGLVEGGRYRFAVRALAKGKGASVEAISDGVTVSIRCEGVDLGANTSDGGGADSESGLAGGGCSCRVGRGAAHERDLALFSILLVLLALLHRVRRRALCCVTRRE